MSAAALPEILETKETLRGTSKTFRCRLVDAVPGAAVVLFVSDAPIAVAGLTLPAGTVTFGYFWEDRPYNVYHWMTAEGRTVGHYFNVSDRTRIGEASLAWRDLVIDVIVRPDAGVEVLDRDELPDGLDPTLRDSIDAATNLIVAEVPAITATLETLSSALFARLFGATS